MADNHFSLLDLPEVPDSIDNSIKNLTDKPTKNMGATIGDLWFLIFGGISHAADKRRMKYSHSLEKFHHELDEATSKIPDSKRLEPSMQLTAQALENSKYCIESDELRSMFVNLISKSIHADYEKTTHPCFAEILKQMSVIDAKILKTIPIKGYIPLADYVAEHQENKSFRLELSNVYISNINGIDIFHECSSISSLSRLGLLKISKEDFITNESVYDPYYETDFYRQFAKDIKNELPFYAASVKKYLGYLTPLGQNFVEVCVL